jgi:hypothetical protein
MFFYDALRHPIFLHDALTYELYFPARWLQDSRLELIPTPFGDNSRAYDAANAMLYYLWLMVPFRSDLIAHSGEFYFIIFSALGLTALSRELGLGKAPSYLPAIFFLSIPLVMREAEAANTDGPLVAQLAAFFAFALAHRNKKGRALDILACMALAGMAGSKFSALSYFPLLLPGFFLFLKPAPGWKRVPVWIGIFVLGGGFWYLRNIYFFHNPVFPLQVQAGSVVIFPGAYIKALMDQWIFKLGDFKQMLATIASTQRPRFQIILAFFLLGTSLAAVVTSLLHIRVKGLMPAYLSLCPLFSFLITAYLVPFHVDRFWIPTWAMATIGIALIISNHPRSFYLFLVFFFLLAAIEIGISAHADNIKIWSLTHPSSVTPGLFLKLAPVAIILALASKPFRPKTKILFWCVIFIGALLFSRPFDPGTGYFARRAVVIELSEEAQFLNKFPSGARIAYAGRNVPYLFMGSNLDHWVFYVNVNPHREWQFHDYTRWFKKIFPNQTPNTPEPAYYRVEENYRNWRENLDSEKVDLLVVCPVGENELVNICHDRKRFPIEESWAEKHSADFQLIFDHQCRIYKKLSGAIPGFSSEDMQTESCPLDALSLLKSNPGDLEKYFPHAMEQIERYGLMPLR